LQKKELKQIFFRNFPTSWAPRRRSEKESEKNIRKKDMKKKDMKKKDMKKKEVKNR